MNQLRKIQMTELEILKFIDKTCEELGLKYSLGGGSMLGAIRHKGFIPWDDDVDLYMSLSDFKKLKKSFKSEQYFLQTPSTDIEVPFSMCKIRKNGTYMPEPEMDCLNINNGIWVDIFLYTNAAKSKSLQKIQYNIYKFLITYRCRYYHLNKKDAGIFHKICCKLPRRVQVRLDSFIVGIISMLGSKKSDRYFCFDVGKNYFYKKTMFDELEKYDFEDTCFWGLKDYDAYLNMLYGPDYMTPKKWGHIDNYDNVIV